MNNVKVTRVAAGAAAAGAAAAGAAVGAAAGEVNDPHGKSPEQRPPVDGGRSPQRQRWHGGWTPQPPRVTTVEPGIRAPDLITIHP